LERWSVAAAPLEQAASGSTVLLRRRFDEVGAAGSGWKFLARDGEACALLDLDNVRSKGAVPWLGGGGGANCTVGFAVVL